MYEMFLKKECKKGGSRIICLKKKTQLLNKNSEYLHGRLETVHRRNELLEDKNMCLVTQSCLTLCYPLDYSPPGSFFRRLFRQEYWNGLIFLFPGDLPNPGIEPTSPALQADLFYPLSHQGSLILEDRSK